LIERLHRQLLDVIKDEFERAGKTDINSVQALLLFNIGDAELTAGELRSRGHYLGSNVSYNLKKLVDSGYINHKRSHMDRRSVRVSLTPAGREICEKVEALGINLCTSMGPWETARLRLKSLGVGVRRFGAACAQVPVSYHGIGLLDAAFVATAHDLGRPVHVWTIDTEAEMDRLIDLGVDGLMTDRPALLKKVLQRRGLWARSIPAPDA